MASLAPSTPKLADVLTALDFAPWWKANGPELLKTLNDARTGLYLEFSFFGRMVMKMKILFVDDPRIKTAAVRADGVCYINPHFWMQLDPAEKAFVLTHELMHLAFLHFHRIGRKKPKRWNKAGDYLINGTLVKAGLKLPSSGPYKGLYNEQYAEEEWSDEEIYADLERKHNLAQANKPPKPPKPKPEDKPEEKPENKPEDKCENESKDKSKDKGDGEKEPGESESEDQSEKEGGSKSKSKPKKGSPSSSKKGGSSGASDDDDDSEQSDGEGEEEDRSSKDDEKSSDQKKSDKSKSDKKDRQDKNGQDGEPSNDETEGEDDQDYDGEDMIPDPNGAKRDQQGSGESSDQGGEAPEYDEDDDDDPDYESDCDHGSTQALQDERGEGQTGDKIITPTQWASILQNSRQLTLSTNRGTVPGNVDRWVNAIQAPKISWQRKLLRLTSATIKRGRSYRYPSRRSGAFAMAMGNSATGARPIIPGPAQGLPAGVFAVDSSASRDDEQLGVDLGEAIGLLKTLQGVPLWGIVCDAEIQHQGPIRTVKDITNFSIPGQGGTAFEPVFDLYKNCPRHKKPPFLVYFTDLAGSFPDYKPDYPVFWVYVGEGDPPDVPFGEVIVRPVKQERGNNMPSSRTRPAAKARR